MGFLEWTMLDTPDSVPGVTKEILNPGNLGSGIIKVVIANDGGTFWAVVRRGDRNGVNYGGAQIILYKSIDGGITWTDKQYENLSSMQSRIENGTFIWNIALAPDDPNFIAVVCADINNSPLAQEVWLSVDGGQHWQNTQQFSQIDTPFNRLISTIDVSISIGGHLIIVGFRDGTGMNAEALTVIKISNEYKGKINSSNNDQNSGGYICGDILKVQFSPNFENDSTLVVVYTEETETDDHSGTWLATGIYDILSNSILWEKRERHIEIKNTNSHVGASPRIDEIVTVDLSLPADFNGRNDESRIFYVCTDAINKNGFISNCGVYRIDNNKIFTLMDTSDISGSNERIRVSSIAYWGTCASGKLLIGEVMGNTNKATVSIYFTDSPISDIPFWYMSKKPSSGAAGQGVYDENKLSYGNAQVIWSPNYADLGVAYVGTSGASLGTWVEPKVSDGAIVLDVSWPSGYVNVIPFDESAFGLTRNNGETWNQLSLINTFLSKLTDIAPSADYSTIYLASVNNNEGSSGFDSVWRSSINERVVAPPLSSHPIGQVWERIRISPTSLDCNQPQSNWAILKLAPDKEDGQILFWAAGGANGATIGNSNTGPNTNNLAWSPDYGDYWKDIETDIPIQDIASESSTILYILSSSGKVQKLSFLTTEFKKQDVVDTNLSSAHTIVTYPEGNVLVGASNITYSPIAALSTDEARSFKMFSRFPLITGNWHVEFDQDFNENRCIYIACDNDREGKVYRNNCRSLDFEWDDIMEGLSLLRGFYGISSSNSNNVTRMPVLYSAHIPQEEATWSSVLRTLTPLNGVPLPGLEYSNLQAASTFKSYNPVFTIEPTAIKYCGCLTPDTYLNLFAIDNDLYASNHNSQFDHGGIKRIRDRGMVWIYTDCFAKKGPILTLDDNIVLNFDQVSGRNPTITFTWEQLAIATQYQIQIALDNMFNTIIVDTGSFIPYSSMSPALVYFAGGGVTSPSTVSVPGLECGKSYYWRCRARGTNNGEDIISPWSERRKFSIQSAEIEKQISIPYQLASTDKLHFQNQTHKYDVFIAHASEDKEFVEPLALALVKNGLNVWYDDFKLKLGQSLLKEIDKGLSQSRYGIVVLSHNFFNKSWPRRELEGLRELEDKYQRTVVLPIWHNIDKVGVSSYSPTLSAIYAVESRKGINTVVNKILEVVNKK